MITILKGFSAKGLKGKKSRRASLIIALIVFACNWTAAGCNDAAGRERLIIEEFRQICHNWMDIYTEKSGDNGDLKDAQVKEYPPGRYFKEAWGLDSSHWVDVRRSESLISPYTGVAVYTLNHYRTEGQLTKEQAESDSEFFIEPIRRITKEYAYRDGRWMVTNAYSQTISINALGGQRYGSPEQYGRENYPHMYEE